MIHPALALLLAHPLPAPTSPVPDAAHPALGPDPSFLRQFAETHAFTLGYPTHVQPAPGGKAVLFLRSAARDPSLALYELDASSGTTRLLASPGRILTGSDERLSVAEQARRERMRITTRGFTTFDLSEDGKRILLSLSGRPYVYERAAPPDSQPRPLLRDDAPVLDPRFSPDGERVAYVKAEDVYAVSVQSGRERRITFGGTAEVTHGLAEFVAQEEMERLEGYWWSPDGKLIAFEQADHRGVERLAIADAARPERAPRVFPYPRPGKANVAVRLGVVPASGGRRRPVWAAWDAERYPYLARVVWQRGGPLSILVQTRDQREEAFLSVDVKTGATTPLLVEKDPAWVPLHPGVPRWLPDGRGFLFATDRSGRSQLELHGPDGRLRRVLLDDGYFSLAHVAQNGSAVYALAATPVATRLLRISTDGGAPADVTPEAGENAVVFARDGAARVVTRTTAEALPASTVYAGDGRKLAELPSVAEPPPFRPNVEMTTVTGASGRTYHAAIVHPRAFDPARRYPVVVSVYGGPSSLEVRSDLRHYLLPQWIADHGVVVVSIDNRGTPRRGRDWSRAIKGHFADVPLDDQVDGLRALAARHPELDLRRVGIYGWSFGGTLAALAVLRRPDVFKVGVAGAPVVDWADYDTHYTERYLDLPDRAPEAYRAASLLTYAADLQRPLLLVHGTADDNVYFFHSLKLLDALFKAGRRVDFLPLAGFTHQVPDPLVRERLWERVADYLGKHL